MPTKRSLIASILSVILCFSMLIGFTFAWFTDTVNISDNKISAGELNIELYKLTHSSWNEYLSDMNKREQFINISDSAEPLFDYNNWEPGYTEIANLQIVNEGTLALKLKVSFVPVGIVSELADVIDVYTSMVTKESYSRDALTAPMTYKVGTLSELLEGEKEFPLDYLNTGVLMAGEAATFSIIFKMQETAGNEYQSLELCPFDIRIAATQHTFENDDFDHNYDADAKYPEVATEGVVFNDEGDYVHNLVEKSLQVVDDGHGTYGLKAENGSLEIVGDGAVKMTAQKDSYAMAVWATGSADVTIKEGTFTLESTSNEEYDLIYVNSKDASIKIEGGTFKSVYPKKTLGVKNHGLGTITVTGGSFWEFDPSNPEADDKAYIIVPEGYKVVSEVKADGTWYTVVAE